MKRSVYGNFKTESGGPPGLWACLVKVAFTQPGWVVDLVMIQRV